MIYAKREKNTSMKKLLAAAIAFVMLNSCKQEIKSLPEPTQTGANTFGAKVNGENFGPLGGGILTKPSLEATHTFDSSILINARNFSRTPVEFEMEIFIKNVNAPGTYTLNQNTEVAPGQSASYAHYLRRNINITDEWITSSGATGHVRVSKIDWINYIVSGTFEFTANARYGSAPITVTEGRFDVRFQ
jgi:hypothetical protein